jgi:uncharacterized protein YcbK (DUF882 family)
MADRRTTIVIMFPARSALSFKVPRAPGAAALGTFLLALLIGLTGQRSLLLLRAPGGAIAPGSGIALASLFRVPGSIGAIAPAPRIAPAPSLPPTAAGRADAMASDPFPALLGPEPLPPPEAAPPPGPTHVTLAASVAPAPESGVIDVKAILRSLVGRHAKPSEADLSQLPSNGRLRLEGLHLGESLDVRPFDDLNRPDPEALAQIDHLMRCRITGHEVNMDPQLIAILTRLHTLYGHAIQVISGHRVPHTIGTKQTSQHALGRAADIRIPGIGIEQLKRVAIKLGARGVGLYPEKGFVHVDVRQKNRYYWVWTAALGEQADNGMARPLASALQPLAAAAEGGEAEGGGESEGGAEAEDGSE